MIGFETAAACDLPGVTCETVTGFPVAGVSVAGVILALFVGPYVWRRFGARLRGFCRRCGLCGAPRFSRCAPDCFCPVCVAEWEA